MTVRADAGIVRHGALAALASVIVNAATFVLYVVIARRLGVIDGGAVLALVSGVLMLSLPASIAGLAVGRVIAANRAAHDTASLNALLGAVVRTSGWISVTVLVLAVIGRSWLAAVLHVDEPWIIVVMAIALGASAVTLLGRSALQGLDAYADVLVSNSVEGAGKITVAFVLVAASASTASACAGFAASLVIAALSTTWLIAKRTVRPLRSSGRMRAALRSSLDIVIGTSALTVMTFFDAIAARHYLAPVDAGLYNAAALAGRALITVLAFVPPFLLPKVTAIEAEGASSRAALRTVGGWTLAVTAGMLAVFCAFPAAIISAVGGSAYAAAASLVPLYGGAASAMALATILATYLLARRTRFVALALVIVAASEVGAIIAYHPSAGALVHVVFAGHAAALAALVGLGLASMRTSRDARASER